MFGHTYRQKVEITVKAFEKALELKNNTKGMVYIVTAYASPDSNGYEEFEFSSFDKAYEYICTSKKREFLDYDVGVAHISTMYFSIKVFELDEKYDETTEFIFDNDFRMTQIYYNYEEEIIDDFAHYNIFNLERCKEDELPEDSSYFSKERFLMLRSKLE